MDNVTQHKVFPTIINEFNYDMDKQEYDLVIDELNDMEKYDNELNRYYESRSLNNKVSVWSEQMSDKLSKESRAHMKEFLNKRGFLLR